MSEENEEAELSKEEVESVLRYIKATFVSAVLVCASVICAKFFPESIPYDFLRNHINAVLIFNAFSLIACVVFYRHFAAMRDNL